MKKNIVYIALSVVFLALSALGIGWLVKQEIEKGKQENQKQSSTAPRRENPRNEGADAEIVIKNKDQANKTLEEIENMMDLVEKDDLAENQSNE